MAINRHEMGWQLSTEFTTVKIRVEKVTLMRRWWYFFLRPLLSYVPMTHPLRERIAKRGTFQRVHWRPEDSAAREALQYLGVERMIFDLETGKIIFHRPLLLPVHCINIPLKSGEVVLVQVSRIRGQWSAAPPIARFIKRCDT